MFREITRLQDAYCAAVAHPLLDLNPNFSEGLLQKICGTVQALGQCMLANSTVGEYYKAVFYNDRLDSSFMVALRSNILSPMNRFGASAKGMRNCLREITKVCSVECRLQKVCI